MKENLKQVGGRVGLGFGALTGLMVVGLMLAGPSSAADEAVTGAFTTLTADIKLYIAAFIALVIVAVGAALGVKYLRKAGGA